MKGNTRILAECSIMVALSAILSVLVIYPAPLGGSVTLFSMAPVLVIGFRHGVKWGMASAFAYSLTQLMLGMSAIAYVPTPAGIILCILLDYVIAFSFLGVSGFFRYNSDMTAKRKYFYVFTGVLIACILRYIAHLLSGAVVWYEITKAGGWNDDVYRFGMWTYSAIYNAQYMVPETILTLIASPAIVTILDLAPRFIKRKSK